MYAGPPYLWIWNPWTADCTSHFIWGAWPVDLVSVGAPETNAKILKECTPHSTAPPRRAQQQARVMPHSLWELWLTTAVKCSPSYLPSEPMTLLHLCWILISMHHSPNNMFPTFTCSSFIRQCISWGQVLDPLFNFLESPRPNTVPDTGRCRIVLFLINEWKEKKKKTWSLSKWLMKFQIHAKISYLFLKF